MQDAYLLKDESELCRHLFCIFFLRVTTIIGQMTRKVEGLQPPQVDLTYYEEAQRVRQQGHSKGGASNCAGTPKKEKI